MADNMPEANSEHALETAGLEHHDEKMVGKEGGLDRYGIPPTLCTRI